MIQLRYRSSLKATNKTQKPVKTVILITCEGKCTEPGYFKAIWEYIEDDIPSSYLRTYANTQDFVHY